MNKEKLLLEIDQLYEACVSNTKGFHLKIDICIAPDYLVEQVFQMTDLNISNHWITIDNFGIIHTLQQHSNPITEAKRGQIAIEKNDFFDLIDVVLFPDIIKRIGQTNRTNLPLLQFEKTIQSKKIVVKEIRTITSTKKKKISRLVFHTMYKFKKPN